MLSTTITSLTKSNENLTNNRMKFISGQLFYGSIKNIFPNHTAIVQVGRFILTAKLEAPLTKDNGYWFQVMSDEGEIHLKTIATTSAGKDASDLIKQLSLPNSKRMKELLAFLSKEPLPLTKESMIKASQWLENIPNKSDGLEILKFMAEKDLPFIEIIFKSLLETKKPGGSHSILRLLENQLLLEEKSSTAQSLLSVIQTFSKGDKRLEQNANEQFGRNDVLQQFKEATKKLGIFYEAEIPVNEVPKLDIKDSLKPLLVKYLQEQIHPTSTKEIAEQFLLKINGQQLLSYESGPIQYLQYEIPIDLFGFKTDLSMQWSGKRTEDGKIDPDFCQILFYLNLEHIDETIVEMKVQNRIISLNIYNSYTSIKEISKMLIPKLKDNLKEMDYTLSAIQFIDSPKEKTAPIKQSSYPTTKTYSRMDIRI